MTLLAVYAGRDAAYLMTDSAAYTAQGSHVELTADKLMLLPELPAATMAGGSFPAGKVWNRIAARLAGEVDDLDEFLARTPAAIRRSVRLAARRTPGNVDLDVYVAGWSPREGRCVAFVFPHDEDYAPTDITGQMHARPTPLGWQPTAIEARRYQGETPLPAGDPPEPATTAAEWVALAKRIHADRACAHISSGQKMWIAGDVTLATVTAADADKRVIHTFTREDFRHAAVGTWHPWGQLGPCICGSGRRYIDCCIPKWRKLPCLCGTTDKKLGQCCALDRTEVRDLLAEHPELADLATIEAPEPPAKQKPTVAAAKVGRNAPCPCGSGRKAKKCACGKVPV